MKLVIFPVLLIIAFGDCLRVDELEVETKFFKVLGHEKDHFTAFEGIPYAEPPIGELRFEPPVPIHTKRDDVIQATKPGNACLQWSHLILDKEDRMMGSEDCLYLNVYTPKNLSKNEKIPVIVYIHGGALMYGRGDYYGPEFLTKRPLIVVTFNYRLGPLGFMSSGCHLMPGNMGMKDQVAALKWVKENIEAFGGDAEKITITGFSAGGASTHFHTMSDMSKGLFTNAISHSGNALDPWVMQRNPDKKFAKVAELVGCGDKSGKKGKVACLKEVKAEDIVRTVKNYQPWLYNPFQVFGVVVEPEIEKIGLESSHDNLHEGEENAEEHHHHHHHTMPFISEHPENLMKSGKVHSTWLVTETKDEGLYPAAEFLRKTEYLPYLEEHWNEIAPHILHYSETIPEEKLNEVSQKIKHHYLGDKPLNEETYKRFVDICTDRLFHVGMDHSAKLQGKVHPTYVYYYNSKLKYGFGELLAGKHSDLLGVAHGDDVLLLFFVEDCKIELSPKEIAMQEKLLDLYESYAKTGVPKFGDVTMEKTDLDDSIKYLDINGPEDAHVKVYDNIGDHKFWNTLGFNEN
ncbi:venom carboxylesterase-6-like [Culicoides brevitarsis]|uniref:venom carboxylesterase-6-like n=1 Tax=Culicoides brevitarsis TaxID=469753 RepID=UPI00307C2A58